jgi:hypothetical protein
MTATLEQELEQLITDADYRVVIAHVSDNYLKMRIVYLPKLDVRGTGGFSYVANGMVAEQHFLCRSPKRRWRKARKWALEEIAGHRAFLGSVTQA